MKQSVVDLINKLLPKMTEKEKLAFYLAFGAHTSTDQRDHSGLEYIAHPLTVYSNCDSEDTRIVALLHDVIEDTEITEKDLALLFDKNIVEAVVLLSHPKGEYDKKSYFENIKANPIARKVKIEDLRNNIDETRLYTLLDWHKKRVESTYIPNLNYLLDDDK